MKKVPVDVYLFYELSPEAKDKAWLSYIESLGAENCPYNQMEYELLADSFKWHYFKDGTYYGNILSENQGKHCPEWEEIG